MFNFKTLADVFLFQKRQEQTKPEPQPEPVKSEAPVVEAKPKRVRKPKEAK